MVSSYQRDDSNAEALGTPLPPYDVNETEDIYQDLEYFEGAGDGNYGHNECDYGWKKDKFFKLIQKISKLMI